MYDHLFKVENPEAVGDDFIQHLNQDSLLINNKAKLELNLQNAKEDISYQFIRNGYFCLDADSNQENLIFNRTVGLKDSWSKKQK